MYLPFPLVLMLSISKWYTMLGQDSLSCPHCHPRALSHQLYDSKTSNNEQIVFLTRDCLPWFSLLIGYINSTVDRLSYTYKKKSPIQHFKRNTMRQKNKLPNLKRDTRHRSNRPGFQLSHISLILARVILTEIRRRLKSRLLRQK